MTTYVAVTSTNPQVEGWSIVCSGEDKKSVENNAERIICGNQWNRQKDIYTQTKLENLRVVTKTKAKRTYKVNI